MNMIKIRELQNLKEKNMRRNMVIVKGKEDRREKRRILNMVESLIFQWEVDLFIFSLNLYY